MFVVNSSKQAGFFSNEVSHKVRRSSLDKVTINHCSKLESIFLKHLFDFDNETESIKEFIGIYIKDI